MAKAKFFNKGLLKGKVVKAEIFKGSNANGDYEFLSGRIDTGNGNKVDFTVSPTGNNPTKHTDLLEEFPVGSMVVVNGMVNERESKKDSRTFVNRGVKALSIKALNEDDKEGATFIIQGIVTKKKEGKEGFEITVEYQETYEDKKTKQDVTKKEPFTLIVKSEDLADKVSKGDNAKFKGKIINQLEIDEYGDVVGNCQMFLGEKIEEVIEADDIEAEETKERASFL